MRACLHRHISCSQLRMPPQTRILVADDDLQLLETMTEAFRRLGADVVQAKSGA